MMSKTRWWLPIVFVALAGLFACAPSEMYKNGEQMMNQNRPDEAIGYFEQAIKEDPDNTDYKIALQQAKDKAAQNYYARAKKAFDASPDPDMVTLEKITKDAALAAKHSPGNSTYAAFDRTAREKMRSVQENLKNLYAAAEQDAAKEDWSAATSKLRQINKIFPNYEDAAARLARAEQEGVKALYAQGVALGSQEDWKMAAQAFKSALDINPSYLDVAAQYEAAKLKDHPGYYDNESEKAAAAGKWERAVLLAEKGLEYDPENKIRQDRLDGMRKKAARIFTDEAGRLTGEGQYSAAVKKLVLAKTYLPAISSEAAYKSTQRTLAGKLMDRAEKFMDRELWGNALVWLQKVEQLNPNQPELFQKLIDARDRINKRIRKSIAVFDFGGPSNAKDAGKIVADKLIAYLHKNASGDLRIIERENLQSILREVQLGQTGIVDIKSAQNLGKMGGIDTFIMGNVLSYSSKLTDTPSTGQVKVLVDEEEQPNPEYQTWLVLHQGRPTEEDMKNAPPRTVKKRNYQFVSYKQGGAKINAMIEVSYKLVDTRTGENILTNTIAGRAVKEDKYQDPVPMANLAHDPLELPTEMEVLDDLTNAKVSEMGQSVLKNYQSLENVYFKDGQMYQKRRSFDQAIEKYVDAIYDERMKGISTPVSQKSTEAIELLISKM